MKKIDFHIHTISTESDRDFSFSMEKLKNYVEFSRLNGIAITNHNEFDLAQFDAINDNISVPVFPGIEIDLEGGQILLIGERKDLNDFNAKCELVKAACPNKRDAISVEQLQDIFGDLSNYILIPHYDKNPQIKEETLLKLNSVVTAGEVSSVKKFMYCHNDNERLVPVYFSDCRIEDNLSNFPVRQTYIDCDELSFAAVKNCLRDKNKVSLSESDGNAIFQIFDDGQKLSTGLNVIIGERSSGKSYTLERIRNAFGVDKVKYLPQFSLVARNEEEDERKFDELLSQKHSLFSRDYLSELQSILLDIRDVDIEKDSKSVSNYLDTLLKHAKEHEKRDIFSKAILFSEEKFVTTNLTGLTEVIDSTKNLVKNEEFRSIIDKHVPLHNLKVLYVDLMTEYNKMEEKRLKKKWLNDLIQDIKSKLQIRTAAPTIAELDLYKVAINLKKVEKFKDVVRLARKPSEIMRKPMKGFEIVASVGEFQGAGELKSLSKRQIAFSYAFQEYDDPYAYLQKLKDIDGLAEADYHQYFVKIDYKILNKGGIPVSGGERSEFYLLQEIQNAQAYDMLLIDEPESSFDNIFLKNQVNEIIKDMSKKMPVVLVTHNNTVGASIKPNYLLYTSKENVDGDVSWKIYSGFPTNKKLLSVDGDSLNTWDVAMGCLEAGADTYYERRQGYEDIRD